MEAMAAIAWGAVACTFIIAVTVYNCWDRWLDYKAERDQAERDAAAEAVES